VILVAMAIPAAAEEKAGPSDANPMAGWKPPKLARAQQDRKEIIALFQAMEEAGKKGDLEAAAALVDFPVLMATDDSKGEGMASSWSREQWVQVMAPFYKKPMDMKVTHKPTVFLVTDSLASVGDEATMTMGGKKVVTRSSTLLVRTGGKWKVKSMAEGGWGDAMQNPPAASQPESVTPQGGAGAAGKQ
jgi:hypothetical protein